MAVQRAKKFSPCGLCPRSVNRGQKCLMDNGFAVHIGCYWDAKKKLADNNPETVVVHS